MTAALQLSSADDADRLLPGAAASSHDNEELLRRVMGRSRDCIKLLDLDGRLLWMNACGLLTLEIGDVSPFQRVPWQELWKGEDRAAAAAAIEDAKAKGVGAFTGFFPTATGVPKWWDVVITPILDAAGRPENLLAISRDVTERRRTEEALRTSQERFGHLAGNIREIFWMSDPVENRKFYVSPAFEKISGRTCASVYENPRSWMDSIHPAERARVLNATLTQQRRGDYDETYRIVRPDGEVRWIRDKAYPVTDVDGAVIRIVGVAEDVTEYRELEEQLRRGQRVEAIGALASGIAHDLNNILAPVLMAPALLRESLPSARDRELLELVEQAARRASAMVRQLLTFSRGTGGERVAVQLRHLLKEMLGLMQETFPRDIVQVDETGRELWPVWGDPTQLHQVIMNLCVNARDAMPAGGRLTLTARNVEVGEVDRARHPAAKTGPHVMIAVTDSGHGIPPEIVDRIFDPFFTTKEPGKGTGLGLSVVQSIVHSHGGFVHVASEPGKGTTIAVHLPASTQGADAATPSALPAWPSGREEFILVVDDEAPIRQATRLLLERHHYRVLTAGDGREALEIFLQHREVVQLVLTDLMMPGMDGLTLIRTLRKVAPRLAVVVTSGLTEEEKYAELNALGVTRVMRKPCAPRELLEMLSAQLAAAG